MCQKFVERLEDELDEAPLGRGVRRLLRKLPGLRMEVDVAPETSEKELILVLTFLSLTTGGHGIQRNR